MKKPEDHPIEFAEWYRKTPPSERSLAAAFAAGKLGQQMELYRTPPPPSKREWRPVHPTMAVRSTVRGLKHLGEVMPQITDGDKVVVCVIATGKKFQSFLDNLTKVRIVDYGKKDDKKKKTRGLSKKAQFLKELEELY